MHAKSDSEVISLPASSPPRSPRSRPLYFVQSPSRESHDGDSKLSFHSTPINLSPNGSPLHPVFSSRSKSGSRKILPQPHSRSFKSSKRWASSNTIAEEPEEFSDSRIPPQIFTILLVLLSCIVFLILFIFLFWLICRPSQPQVSLKNIIFHNFIMGEGNDASGVPTKMISLNCSVQLNLDNPSKYFGVHVDPVDVALDYSELNIAQKSLSYFQAKSSRKTISVVVQAVKVPVYGAGEELSTTSGSKQGVPLTMVATLYSKYYVVGKMVKPKFRNQVSCNIVLDLTTMALLTRLRSSCTYN